MAGLIYAFESGALNEAYSDMYGQAIDILNVDTTDSEQLRTVWPTVCTTAMEQTYANMPPGTDVSLRWTMGEDVIGYVGGLRDMYKPECFYNPSTVSSSSYVCSVDDEGGVHANSGVPNRLFSVLVDGGKYDDPSNPGTQLTVAALGMTKATNLIWRTELALTSTTQFYDWGYALQVTCRLLINQTIYVPNLLSGSTTPVISSSPILSSDCDNLDIAIKGSGIMNGDNWCPNLICSDVTYCEFVSCPASGFTAEYEVNSKIIKLLYR